MVEKNWLVKGKYEFTTRKDGNAVFFYGENERDKYMTNYEYYEEEFKNLNLENIFRDKKKIFISGLIGSGL